MLGWILQVRNFFFLTEKIFFRIILNFQEVI